MQPTTFEPVFEVVDVLAVGSCHVVQFDEWWQLVCSLPCEQVGDGGFDDLVFIRTVEHSWPS